MRISLIQTDLVWENIGVNLDKISQTVKELDGKTDLVVLPEMCTTGFSMNSHLFAETNDGQTICTLKEWSTRYKLAITGSFMANTDGRYYNRVFFLTPDGKEYYYDKKHLFRMGEELHHFESGNEYSIISYMGWNIRLAVCYDLRFPVWLRNRDNEYDLLIVVANWPEARKKAWEILLYARAIENQCYVCGVNRVGKDGNGFQHSGNSLFINPKGECMTQFDDYEEGIRTIEPDLASIQSFREKFPAWKDADPFTLG